MSAVLFIVATPIGNLQDISLRAVDTLKQVDLIAAEDTRHSQRLLSHLGIKNRLLSLHEHNERARIQQMLDLLEQGQRIALISDAGTPLISDPGYPLVQAALEVGYQVVPVPGPSSVIAALSAAGLPTDRFCFHGFLSHKNQERLQRLEELGNTPGTQVLLESTHRIERLLEQMQQVMPELLIVLAKELTKQHERFIRGTPEQCLQQLATDKSLIKGEFVVLFHVADKDGAQTRGMDEQQVLSLLLNELPLKKAVKLTVALTGGNKNDLYRLALRLSGKQP